MTVWDTCTLCPRLCRSACPVATGSAREAATPSWIASALREWEAGRLDDDTAARAATLCTDCGACQAYCHLDRPLPEALRATRKRLLTPPALEPLRPLVGEGALVAVEADDRPWGIWLSKHLNVPVKRWITGDRLGVDALEHDVFDHRAAHIVEVVGSHEVVVADGGVASGLIRASVAWTWLTERVPEVLDGGALGSCVNGGARALACCGGAGPLARYHEGDAARVANAFVRRGSSSSVADTRCAAHLRAAGLAVSDPVDRLRQLVEGV